MLPTSSGESRFPVAERETEAGEALGGTGVREQSCTRGLVSEYFQLWGKSPEPAASKARKPATSKKCVFVIKLVKSHFLSNWKKQQTST